MSAPTSQPAPEPKPRAPKPRAVVRRAVIDALAMPSIVLFASMAGFGSLCRDSGLGLGIALGATFGIWGLPGQIALAELYAAGADTVALVMAVSMANARFLPMAVSFVPLLRVGLGRHGWLYALVQLMSINTWAAGLREFPGLPGPLRRLYYTVFAGLCMSAALAGTAAGYYATGSLPRPVTLGLVFMNPLFFALLFAGTRNRLMVLALIAGALVGPPLHLLSPDWGVLAAGLIAGSAAFLGARAWDRRRTKP